MHNEFSQHGHHPHPSQILLYMSFAHFSLFQWGLFWVVSETQVTNFSQKKWCVWLCGLGGYLLSHITVASDTPSCRYKNYVSYTLTLEAECGISSTQPT